MRKLKSRHPDNLVLMGRDRVVETQAGLMVLNPREIAVQQESEKKERTKHSNGRGQTSSESKGRR